MCSPEDNLPVGLANVLAPSISGTTTIGLIQGVIVNVCISRLLPIIILCNLHLHDHIIIQKARGSDFAIKHC